MEIFDFDYINGGVSKYDTHHIHMFVDGEIAEPISTSTNVVMGKLIHEYVHYWQHISTLFGVKICTEFAKIGIAFVAYCREKKDIELPIDLKYVDPRVSVFDNWLKKLKGDKYARCEVDYIEIYNRNIAQARRDRTSVKIGAYDYKNNVALDTAFHFGYICVIETMAHIIQNRINPKVEHDIVPYLSGIKVYEYITGRKISSYQEENLLITLCYGALQHDNPGVAFIEGAYVIMDENITDWNDLYDRIMSNMVTINGKKFSFKQALINFLSEYETYLQESIGAELVYYNKVLENIKIAIANDRHIFLDMVFSCEISNPKLVKEKLFDYYGYPFIEDNKTYIFPTIIDSAALRGLEILMTRFQYRRPDTTCPWYKVCSKKKGVPIVTIECRENQWDKTEKCLFTEALRYFRLSEKKIIQI